MKICKNCKFEMKDDDVFCMNCGTKAEVADEASNTDPFAEEPIQPQNSATSDKPVGIVEKAKAFESKHNIILNAIVIACAIVVLFVSLFAPIKVMNYDRLGMTEADGSEITKYYAESGQSIFQVIGSVFYFNASEKQKNELTEQYTEARKKYDIEYSKWRAEHRFATSREQANASNRIFAECLSEVNLFGSVFASTKSENMSDGSFLAALVTAILAIVIAILSIATAILSLVYIIKAILNIVHKKPQTNLFKYLSTVLGLSISGIVIMSCAPMLIAGGNMFAVALFAAIAYLCCATVGAFIGKINKAVIIKRIVISVVSMVAFFILCSNVFVIAESYNTMEVAYSIDTYVPSGSGLYGLIHSINGGDANDGAFISSIVGAVMCVLVALFFVPYVGNIMRRSLCNINYVDGKKSSVTALAIAAVVFAVVAIVVGFLSRTITEQLFKLYDAPEREITTRWLAYAQVWVSMFLMLAVAIFNKVFLPNDVKRIKN